MYFHAESIIGERVVQTVGEFTVNSLQFTVFSRSHILRMIAQQLLFLLKRRNNKTTYTITRLVVLGYWTILGLVIIVCGIAQLGQNNLLAGIGGLAFGLGLMLGWVGHTLERSWLRRIGTVVLSIGPAATGIGLIHGGDALGGMIGLALGLGIVATILKGKIGAVGRVVVGAVLIGCGVMLIIGPLMAGANQPDFAMVGIGIVLLLIGLAGIVGGALTLLVHLKLSSPQEQQITTV